MIGLIVGLAILGLSVIGFAAHPGITVSIWTLIILFLISPLWFSVVAITIAALAAGALIASSR